MKNKNLNNVCILKKIAIKGNYIKIWYKDIEGIKIKLLPPKSVYRKYNNLIAYNTIYRIVN